MSAMGLLADPRLFDRSAAERPFGAPPRGVATLAACSAEGPACLWRGGRPTAHGRLLLALEYLDSAGRFPCGTRPTW